MGRALVALHPDTEAVRTLLVASQTASFTTFLVVEARHHPVSSGVGPLETPDLSA